MTYRPETPDNRIRHVVNVSGGKDSTATLLLALETVDSDRITPIFTDTGNEHELTYQYIDDLETYIGMKIVRVQADFTRKIMGKRATLEQKWTRAGVERKYIDSALEYLWPSGNPFLDLCLYRAGFPSAKRRFCTDDLKQKPAMKFVLELLDDEDTEWIWQWLGIRRDESPGRKYAREWEDLTEDIGIYRPIVRWTALDTFEACTAKGVPWNPLYEHGLRRVGCFPCVMVRKDELNEIATRFPEEIDRIHSWEKLVSKVAKQYGATTFLPATNIPGGRGIAGENAWEHGNIHEQVEWAKTRRGGGGVKKIRKICFPPRFHAVRIMACVNNATGFVK